MKTHVKSQKHVTGDKYGYFFWHSLLTGGMFLVFVWFTGLYNITRYNTFDVFFNMDFWTLVIIVFLFTMICGYVSRVIVYRLMKWFYSDFLARKTKHIRTIKSWDEINTGVNSLGMSWILTSIISTVIFLTGMVMLIQTKIFDNTSIGTVVLTYILVKAVIGLLVNRMLHKF